MLKRIFVVLGLLGLALSTSTNPRAQCGPNPIVCENLNPGALSTEWDVSGAGDSTIQGFATSISVNKGETVHFKVDTVAPTINIDIYRLGYYGGRGARKMASITGVNGTNQSNCLTNGTTGLVDCGNWVETSSWAVPSTSVSGVYIAKLTRIDTGGTSHIPFVVRDDQAQADMVMQTSDTTWHAYNQYGGNSLYVGGPATSPSRAYKVSYNRPITTRNTSPEDYLFNAEYPTIRYLESNGFNVSYISGVDTDRIGATELLRHKIFLSVGHDEYWSGPQRANVEAARAAGVSMAFFSGNEVFWKTRWENSIDGSNTAYRTLVCYKETHANAKIDPAGAGMWTGTWRDARFSPPADGGRPENALTGTIFTVNAAPAASTIRVTGAYASQPFWRNTRVASLAASGSTTLTPGILGYEWDEDLDNGSRPTGLITLATTTVSGVDKLQDNGSTYATGTATHSLTLYRHASGAWVFGGGTVQWAWGLDNNHDRGSAAADLAVQQSTLNLFIDMGVQPATLQPGLVSSPAINDTVAPTSTITAPAAGATIPSGTAVTITGTASDTGGGSVNSVQVSLDGGVTWNLASGLQSWTYNWVATGAGFVTIKSRAIDNLGNTETPSAGITFTVSGSGSGGTTYTIWSPSTVPNGADPDPSRVEIGVKFRSNVAGSITGIRYYKFSTNTGAHVGSLWSSAGTKLATATFANETTTGWQQVLFPSPVAINANTTYIASYHTNVGRYAVNSQYFAAGGATNGPLTALANGVDGGNGVYAYNTTTASVFPNQTYNSENYWVDVVFATAGSGDITPPRVSAVTPVNGAGGVAASSTVTAVFSEPMDATTVTGSTVVLRDSLNAIVAATVSYNAGTRTATLTPSAALPLGKTYTATVLGGTVDPRAKDSAGNALAANVSWSFTTLSGVDTAPPTIVSQSPAAGATGVATSSTVTATFSEAMNAATIDPTTVELRNGAVLVASTVSYNATTRTVTLQPSAVLAGSTTYTATVRGGTTDPRVKDSAGNALAANATWSFTTAVPDTTPPTVTAKTPAAGAVGVDPATAVTATFSEAMDATTISTTTVELRNPANALVAATATYSSSTRVVTLQPTAILANSTTYTATVKGGATDPRVKDAAGNALAANMTWSFTTAAPPPPATTIWQPTVVPAGADGDPSAVEVGVKFRTDIAGYITGLRFYKFSNNTGTHVGHLWSRTGTLLATATFSGESASGWQQVDLTNPVAVAANTTYVASYFAPVGHYATNSAYFAAGGADNAPLHAIANGVDGGNGVYAYGASGTFPSNSFNSENYWVDVVYATSLGPDTTPPVVASVSPLNAATAVSATSNVTAVFSEPMDATTIGNNTVELRGPGNVLVPSAISYNSTTRTITVDPTANLAYLTSYTAFIRGGAGSAEGTSGVKDVAGNAMAADYSWSFTTAPAPGSCPCSIWPGTTTPAGADGDPSAVEIGVKFQADANGFITALRFYKFPNNTGTHVGHLFSRTGTLLATATYTNETTSGWQQVTLPNPVAVTANTTYITAYHTTVGHYAVNSAFFNSGVTNAPLRALANGVDGGNGVYGYGAAGTFPANSFNSENYWVDVVYSTSVAPDTTAPTVSATNPPLGATGVDAGSNVVATFSEAVNATTVSSSTFELRDSSGSLVPATITYDGASLSAVLDPTSGLTYSTTYTATVRGGGTDPRIKDLSGNALAANKVWTFTTGAAPPPPPTDGPGGPILIVSSSGNPFSRYYAEILRAEGLNAFTATDLTTVNATMLAGYDVVILGEVPLTAAQVTMFSDWVTAGGNLIAMRPDKKLAALLGLSTLPTTLSNAYLLVDTSNAPGTGIVNQSIQFHGTADVYTLGSAASVASLYSGPLAATPNPAVSLNNVGPNGGHAAAFTYDLARSIVYTRQGNPAWAGQERDGFTPMRSDDLFFDSTGNDWVNLDKVAIPQADEQQRLLANLVVHMNRGRKPLPRFWYFPRGSKAVVVLTGDDHANGGTANRFNTYKAASPAGCSVANWECIRGTSYIYSNTPISNAVAASYVAEGFEIALHVNTNCSDWTPSTLQTFFTSQLSTFASTFPGLPAPTTNRTHCMVWSDYATHPQVELGRGIRLDTNYYYWPGSWIDDRPGFFTGSGMPMRFVNATGTLMDIYQATTQMTDESDQTFPFTVTSLLDKAVGAEGYYGAFTANMHNDFNPSPGSIGADAIVTAAKARGVPVVSARQLLTWLDGRNGSSFQGLTWSGNVLSFSVAVGTGANGLQTMVPTLVAAGHLTSITLNGSPVAFTTQTIKGIQYAIFQVAAGTYQATYAP